MHKHWKMFLLKDCNPLKLRKTPWFHYWVERTGREGDDDEDAIRVLFVEMECMLFPSPQRNDLGLYK